MNGKFSHVTTISFLMKVIPNNKTLFLKNKILTYMWFCKGPQSPDLIKIDCVSYIRVSNTSEEDSLNSNQETKLFSTKLHNRDFKKYILLFIFK